MLSYLPIVATFFIIAASVSPVRRSKLDSFIIGGENTKIQMHPYQVSLQYLGSFICGGSIISKYYVLTTAHCLQPFEARDLTIRAGSTFANKGGKVHKVKGMHIHEEYHHLSSGIPVHDIGLIRVSESFKFDKTKQPIPLFRTGEEAKANEVAVATGWGRTEYGFQNILQSVRMSMVTRNDCLKAYKPYEVPEGQICTGTGKGICWGDSGGPLVVRGKLAGVTSWGFECGSSQYPDVSTEVAYYYEWIISNTEL